ncbi:hypothetical protein BN2475_550028 [Paraburkholderia ribeironis]|uniref:Uncharacterized protein n=1 Tax=Paraburkholderia ribeironis TaxID=1247936 RepID=A0A1N7SDB4_9BURK|nr:hypothetical protein BN2475_550028 [Paraburkholderia ribeironis]
MRPCRGVVAHLVSDTGQRRRILRRALLGMPHAPGQQHRDQHCNRSDGNLAYASFPKRIVCRLHESLPKKRAPGRRRCLSKSERWSLARKSADAKHHACMQERAHQTCVPFSRGRPDQECRVRAIQIMGKANFYSGAQFNSAKCSAYFAHLHLTAPYLKAVGITAIGGCFLNACR